MKQITKVYTKTGDKGTTGLIGGVRISKSHVRLEAYGSIDELNSFIGLLDSIVIDDHIKSTLTRIQSNLFTIGSYLATDQTNTPLSQFAKLKEGETEYIEKEIDTILDELPERHGFVLPGGCQSASMSHVCRTICRRAERRIIGLSEKANVGEDIISYVNRLSDFFFVLAKKLNFLEGKEEKTWETLADNK